MYERKVILQLTENEWLTLCDNAKSSDRTPRLQARYLLKSALGLSQEKSDCIQYIEKEPRQT
jgi:hypothetical protein